MLVEVSVCSFTHSTQEAFILTSWGHTPPLLSDLPQACDGQSGSRLIQEDPSLSLWLLIAPLASFLFTADLSFHVT